MEAFAMKHAPVPILFSNTGQSKTLKQMYYTAASIQGTNCSVP